MNKYRIPFMDLKTHHRESSEEYINAFRQILYSAQFVNGPSVSEFEDKFASFCGTNYAIGVGSGTDALRFSLIAAGIKHGDIVLTVPNTFIATSEAISQAGATPVFIDVDEDTMTLSSTLLENFLNEQCFVDNITGETIHTVTGKPVRAVIPVHLYGQMVNMDEIMRIAAQFRLIIIEDSCQAHGASLFSSLNGTKQGAGTFGLSGAFSFYPGKNLGACGEAGAITTNDESLAVKITMLRDHGQIEKYFHEVEGYNGRLDSIQASLLLLKLNHLHEWNNQRISLAFNYSEALKNCPGITIPFVPAWSFPVYHLYVIRVRHRDMLQSYLAEKSIETALHYPIPLHLQKAYRNLGYTKGSFPVSEKCANEILSLPLYPGLSEVDQSFIIDNICNFSKSVNS